MSWMVPLGLVIALAVTVRVEEGRIGRERARVADLALEASNVIAERDSTRDVAMTVSRVASMLADSLRVAERRVVQRRQAPDKLDGALGRERVARYRITAAVDSLVRAVKTASVVDTATDTRRATFEVRQVPYTINADVAIPAPPDSARMAIGVALDSIPMDLRLGCAAPNRDGIRAASVDAATPRWATVQFIHVEQAPELCSSAALMTSHAKHGFGFAPLTAGVGRALTLEGNWTWALFIGGGLSAW